MEKYGYSFTEEELARNGENILGAKDINYQKSREKVEHDKLVAAHNKRLRESGRGRS